MNSLLLVRHMIEHPYTEAWSFQGFGMFRLYLSKAVRLHVWVPSMATPDVTTIHTHPWDFTSEVLCGEVRERVYKAELSVPGYPVHVAHEIQCGSGAKLTKALGQRWLRQVGGERTVSMGETYRHYADDIHESFPMDGTVTIVTRRFREDEDHARVYVPAGKEFVSAEPRPATAIELRMMKAATLPVIDATLGAR